MGVRGAGTLEGAGPARGTALTARGGTRMLNATLPHPRWGEEARRVRPDLKREAQLRLRSAAGHLESVRRMVDADVYCVDLMKQVAAVQGALEGVQHVLLRSHLSTCVADAVRRGMGEELIDELLGALRYDKSLVNGHGGPASLPEAGPGAAAPAACGQAAVTP
jgi:DNA-binding FrmR family transcriptional regulator